MSETERKRRIRAALTVVRDSPRIPWQCQSKEAGLQCCCLCAYRLELGAHTDVCGSAFTDEGYGYVCAGLAAYSGVVYAGWSEHGLCEEFSPKREGGSPW